MAVITFLGLTTKGTTMMGDASTSGSLPLPDPPRAFQAYVKSRSREQVGESHIDLSILEVVQVNIDLILGIITFEFANGNKYHYPFEQYEQIWLRSGDAPSDDGH